MIKKKLKHSLGPLSIITEPVAKMPIYIPHQITFFFLFPSSVNSIISFASV